MKRTGGFALLCDSHGNITKVLSNSLGPEMSIQTGMPFARLAVRGGLAKALSFVTEINTLGAAYNWEINIAAGEQVKTLHFTGSKINADMLIVGAESEKFALKLYEEMVLINNEQTNTLRAALKEQSQIKRENSIYDEISRLNNELVSMQRELAKKNAELERLNQEKNRFLGMAAHDLRNSLYVIMTASDLLLSANPAEEPITNLELLQTIHATSEFMAHLVDDLLDVARIEAGELKLEYSAVDLSALLMKNAAFNRPLAARKQIRIDYKLEPIPTALVDITKLEQVLNNLIGNAVKFSEPGSQIEVRLEAAGDNFQLSVRDLGVGIPPEQLPRLFRPFQRGQKGTGGETSIGLGLVIVKRIVEGQGGKIWVESEVGRGTTFSVLLPIMAEA